MTRQVFVASHIEYKDIFMATKIKDENGIYREINPRTGEFIEEYPLTNNIGHLEHQLVHTSEGRTTDPDYKKSDVVDEMGISVIEEDEVQIKKYIKDAISINNLVSTFNESSHDTLLKLLALQSNNYPLKKGGVGIAYRTDALIMHCKMEFTADENIVFDAILGTMSSFPENKIYTIEPSNFKKYAKYADDKYLYNVFRKGAEKLSERPLVFENLGPDGEDKIKVPWFNILRYHSPRSGNNAFIEFSPSDFFKDLALCSQIVHGAYGSIEVTTQLQGKYTIALYWYLENMKNYREYPGATPGIVDIELDVLKHQFSIPNSYKKADIDRRVLEPAKNSINSIEECDFTFSYEALKENGSVAGYRFIIKSKDDNEISIIDDAVLLEDNSTLSKEQEIKMMLSFSNLDFSDTDVKKIALCAKKNNKDSAYMMQIIAAFNQRLLDKQQEPIIDQVGYLCKMIIQGANTNSLAPKIKKSAFNNFEGRNIDYDELEKQLIESSKDDYK